MTKRGLGGGEREKLGSNKPKLTMMMNLWFKKTVCLILLQVNQMVWWALNMNLKGSTFMLHCFVVIYNVNQKPAQKSICNNAGSFYQLHSQVINSYEFGIRHHHIFSTKQVRKTLLGRQLSMANQSTFNFEEKLISH